MFSKKFSDDCHRVPSGCARWFVAPEMRRKRAATGPAGWLAQTWAKMAVEQKNLCVFLSSRPGVSNPPTEANFSVKHTEVKSCEDGEVLVKTLFLSVDPYMRCRLNEESGASYVSSWKIGETLQGGGVGVVVESRNESFKAGDVVQSMAWPWQTYAVFFKETESWMSQPTKVSPRSLSEPKL